MSQKHLPSRRRILVTPRSVTQRGLDEVRELDPLRDAGYELVSGPPGAIPSRDQLQALLPGCVGWLAGVEPIDREVLAAAPDLLVISRNGTGVDAIDLQAAEDAGVAVARAAGANAQGVAELTLAVTLSLLRDVPWSASALRQGRWERRPARELADLRVGVVGLGEVGRRVADLFTAVGAHVAGTDPFARPDGIEWVGFDELVSRSDVLTLHVPPRPEGPLVTTPELEALPHGAILVNTARAALVDTDAVLSALDDGGLAAYAVDAFDTEPPDPSRLLAHERVLATPHLGGYTNASIRRAVAEAVTNLLSALTANRAAPAEARS